MEENVVRQEYCGKEIILVATAHVLKQSADLIKRVSEAPLVPSLRAWIS